MNLLKKQVSPGLNARGTGFVSTKWSVCQHVIIKQDCYQNIQVFGGKPNLKLLGKNTLHFLYTNILYNEYIRS